MLQDLYKQAGNFITVTPYFKTIRLLGSLFFTGSYFLNTMTWPDIDMQLCAHDGLNPKEALARLSSYLIKIGAVQKIDFRNFIEHPKEAMPSGLCLMSSYFDKNIKNYWNLDLWILTPVEFQKNRMLMDSLKNKITLAQHKLIMMIKKE